MIVNYAGLAELGWRATQTIAGKNGYDDWDAMDDVEKQILQHRWQNLAARERQRLEKIVCAATDAFARAVAV